MKTFIYALSFILVCDNCFAINNHKRHCIKRSRQRTTVNEDISKTNILNTSNNLQTKVDTATFKLLPNSISQPQSQKNDKSMKNGIIETINSKKYEFLASITYIKSNSSYDIAQAGLSFTYFNKANCTLAAEMQIGIASDCHNINPAFNVSPIKINYQIKSDLSFGVIPDMYLRLYNDGTNFNIGAIGEIKYNINPVNSINTRLGYSGGFFIGICVQSQLRIGK